MNEPLRTLTVQHDVQALETEIRLRGGRVMIGDVLRNVRSGEYVAVTVGGAVAKVTRGIGSQAPWPMMDGDELHLIGTVRYH